jgi:hypothetical protein
VCHQCRHEVIMNVDHLPGDLTVPSFGPKMVCTKCGTIGAVSGRIGGRGSAEAAASDDAGGCALLRQTHVMAAQRKSHTEAGQLSVGCAHVERLSSVSQPASIEGVDARNYGNQNNGSDQAITDGGSGGP